VVIGTKVRFEDQELDDPLPVMRTALQDSLKRLKRDTLDVYVLHNFPRITDVRNAVRTSQLGPVAAGMRALQREGLVRSIGFTGVGDTPAINEAVESGLFDFVQVYFNVLNPSAVHAGANGGGQDFAGVATIAGGRGQTAMGVRTMAGGALVANEYRSPLAGPVGNGGGLGGSPYSSDLARARELVPVAEAAGCENVVEFGLRFAISEPKIATALVGFSDMDQVEEAIGAARRGPLETSAVEAALMLARATSGAK
jgi:aryl-alcohol dehydrogenase-like predicted oxidoreductase